MLTIDAGNSGLKWGLWAGEALVTNGKMAYGDSLTQQLDSQWTDLTPPTQVVVSNVAGSHVLDSISQWITRHWQVDVHVFKSQKITGKVRNAYPEVSQMGSDRWAAITAACHLYAPPLCIIDAGTAVTIDLVDDSYQHLGGRILPGEDLMKSSLLERAPEITRVDGQLVHWAGNTADAVTSGARFMLQAALVSVIKEARQQLGDSMVCVQCGGGMDIFNTLHEDGSLWKNNPEKNSPEMTVHREPHLILYGLRLHGAGLGDVRHTGNENILEEKSS